MNNKNTQSNPIQMSFLEETVTLDIKSLIPSKPVNKTIFHIGINNCNGVILQ